MPPVRPSAYLYTTVTVALWAVLLPAVLIRDQGPGVPLRPFPLLLLAAAVLVVGTGLIHYPGRQLASAGVGLFGMTPGRVLVTDGWYRRVRNPIDIGTTLVAVSAWAAFDVTLMWVVPSAALINFAVAAGLYEDRRLFEAFGDDFTAYRRRVGKWIP
mgnify:CR=1 FL=1